MRKSPSLRSTCTSGARLGLSRPGAVVLDPRTPAAPPTRGHMRAAREAVRLLLRVCGHRLQRAAARLDRQEDSLMAGLAAELTDPGSTGCEDHDFEDEIQHIAMELNRG